MTHAVRIWEARIENNIKNEDFIECLVKFVSLWQEGFVLFITEILLS